jgi:thiamine kinase-like enzyme
MSENDIKEVLAALQNLPDFKGINVAALDIQRLGGLTNLVFRVAANGQSVIVRIPGQGTEDYIDRAVEIHNARVAADAGVSPDVLWADSGTGVMISDCIEEGIVTMTPEQFSTRSGSPARAGAALRQLHGSDKPFEFRFELFAMIEDYLGILANKDIDLPDGYAGVVADAAPVRKLLEEKPEPLVPSHCDPLCENFLDDGNRMWIVDYEYSGMNDAMWDLGDLSVEANMTDAQDREMLMAYFGQPPTAAQLGRMVVYKAMCDLLWTLWGLIQHADRNPADDFWAYAIGRFERCKALMDDDSFGEHLDAIRAASN